MLTSVSVTGGGLLLHAAFFISLIINHFMAWEFLVLWSVSSWYSQNNFGLRRYGSIFMGKGSFQNEQSLEAWQKFDMLVMNDGSSGSTIW